MDNASTYGTPKKDPDWAPGFIKALASTGNVRRACIAARIGRNTAYARRRGDRPFAAKWRRAKARAADRLEAEAWRRAYKGTLRPVYHGGKKVGAIREYSDTLLIFLLKGVRPNKFRDNARIEHTGKNGQPIQSKIDLSALSDDELIKFERAFAGRNGGTGEPGVN